ncbi:MAG: sigma-70 family RNA polymerase sigma factor [Clostridia bacterium]|nr:sigma-70 family RNA polymerase sigma factor [Clostridia bacterium]
MIDQSLDRYIIKLKNGDSNAFNYIYDKTNKAVFFAIYNVLKDREKTKDVMQETYLTAYNKIDMYNLGTNFIAWIVVMGKRLALNELKKYGKEFNVDFSENESLYGEYSMQDNYDTSTLDTARKVLKPDEYEILVYCAISGYKRREVAKIMNIPIGTVTWKYNNAIKRIKEELTEKEV